MGVARPLRLRGQNLPSPKNVTKFSQNVCKIYHNFHKICLNLHNFPIFTQIFPKFEAAEIGEDSEISSVYFLAFVYNSQIV